MTDRLLSTGDVAKRLGISPRTLARYVREGWIEPTLTLPTGHHRWRWEDVKDQLKQIRESERDRD